MQIFKGGREGVEAALLQKALHTQFNTRRFQHVLAFFTVNLSGGGQGVAIFVFVNQGIDVAVADGIHHLHQIAHCPGVDREAELDLRGDFIAIGNRHFTHVVAKAAHFQMTGILFRHRMTHPEPIRA